MFTHQVDIQTPQIAARLYSQWDSSIERSVAPGVLQIRGGRLRWSLLPRRLRWCKSCTHLLWLASDWILVFCVIYYLIHFILQGSTVISRSLEVFPICANDHPFLPEDGGTSKSFDLKKPDITSTTRNPLLYFSKSNTLSNAFLRRGSDRLKQQRDRCGTSDWLILKESKLHFANQTRQQ